MKIRAEKIVSVYADVYVDGREYRVWPDGRVEEWAWYTDVDGYWSLYNDYESDYPMILDAGLVAING